MFDHLIWWQVLALLAPVVGLTYYIRWAEQMAMVTPYKTMSPYQKAWVILSSLPPGLSAQMMGRMDPDELNGYIEGGKSLRGYGPNLADPVIREMLADCKSAPSEGHPVDRLCHWVAQEPAPDTLGELRKRWPAPRAGTSQPVDLPT